MEPTATHSSNPASSNSSSSTVLQLRQKHYGKNAALSYKEPLHIVRGQGCCLYDEAGTEYLDCVNNVASVGHANPQVTIRRHISGLLHAFFGALPCMVDWARVVKTLVA
jgi:4-aminobutyrate aminotransferase-like enzyme